MPEPDIVDWELAASTGVRLVRPGPPVPLDEAREVVAELRQLAVEARGHVRAYTGLDAPIGDNAVVVVDRPSWIRANAVAFRQLTDPLLDVLRRKPLSPGVMAVGSRATALEVGAALAWMSTKVLGQYELVPTGATGRLLLVAPNIVSVERQLDVDPTDFRMWVCLHEETHRVQFGAVPWLRQHVLDQIRELVVGLSFDRAVAAERVRDVTAAVFAALRGSPGPSLVEAAQSPEQREALVRMTAVLSLLEGHAEVVMDGVGPTVVPTVAVIRERFQHRREVPSRVDGAIRRLLGMDAKLRQYRDGAQFVRQVVDQVGMSGFNRVWEGPALLPSAAEIADPASWVARVHPAVSP